MEIFSRLTDENLTSRFARILLASLDCEAGRVVVVTPWIKNVRLPIEGHQASHFGAHLSEATLEEVLARVAQRHELHLVVKAPQELVGLWDVERLVAKVESRERVLQEEELAGYAIRDELIAGLNADIAQLVEGALRHFDTVEFALRLHEHGAEVHFLSALHAKLLWTPLHAFFGSANFTHGGFNWNDELVAEVTDPGVHAKLGAAADGFLFRATALEDFDITLALKREGFSPHVLRGWANRVPRDEYTRLTSMLSILDTLGR
jgi:hypothetical protein